MSRSSFLLVVLGACGGAVDPNHVTMPAQPPAVAAQHVDTAPAKPVKVPALEPLEHPACKITAASGKTEYSLKLKFEGKEFATIGAELTNVDVRLAEGTSGGTMTATRDGITLTGQVVAGDIWLEGPVGYLHQGYLEVRGAITQTVDADGTMHARVGAPQFVLPVAPEEYVVPCAQATFFSIATPPAGKKEYLKDGASTSLRTTLGGPVVADVLVPAGTEPSKYQEVIVLDTKGKSTRVRVGPFDELVYAWGWIDTAALDKGTRLMPVEEDDPIELTPKIHCDHDVPIFVHEGDHPLQVGVAKKGAGIPVLDRKAQEPPVDLRLVPTTGPVKYGMQVDPLTLAFVTQESLQGCR